MLCSNPRAACWVAYACFLPLQECLHVRGQVPHQSLHSSSELSGLRWLCALQKSNSQEEAAGLCKEEFQCFMKYFASPLIQLKLLERYRRPDHATDYVSGNTGKSKVTFRQVFDQWNIQLQGAYANLKPFHAKASCSARDAKSKGWWFTHKGVPVSAYKPTPVPFFLTMDNAPCHSFWLDSSKKLHMASPGVPLLQLIRMPPHGHDLHQMIEHSIGITKSFVKREVESLHVKQCQLHVDELLALVSKGAAKFGAEAWDRNLDRLHLCLELVGAERGTYRQFEYRGSMWTLEGTAGNYCYMGLS
jgi:hypothetical protein